MNPNFEESICQATAAIALRPELTHGYAEMLRSIPKDQILENFNYRKLFGSCVSKLQEIDGKLPALVTLPMTWDAMFKSLAFKKNRDELKSLITLLTDMRLTPADSVFNYLILQRNSSVKFMLQSLLRVTVLTEIIGGVNLVG